MDRLLQAVEIADTRGDPSAVEITSVELDSRHVQPGALFCCVVGRVHDGHDFAPLAVAAGASGLLVERPLTVSVPQGVVPAGSMRPTMVRAARALYGDPARDLLMVGVTGTNGKTTVTHLLASVLEAHGLPTEVIGTLHGPRTTPEAPVLQALLARARDEGRRAVSMEVSSHALSEGRVDGIRFSAAVFTNLGHDHLDYHGTLEAYFEAKASLFTPARAAVGVVNADDDWGRRLLADAAIDMVPFSTGDAVDVVASPDATRFTWRGRRIELALRGDYHVANAVAAATTAAALGVPDDEIAAGLAAAGPVPGRFEVVTVPGEAPTPFTVVVDYAHTPDGLRAALASARRLAGAGRVLVVFGCGGDRDQAKRPAMGAAAATSADLVVVTSDNPRSEDPMAIIEAVLGGVGDRSHVVVEPDRRAAIGLAVADAAPGDVVVVAGKGHEQTIESKGTTVAFDDRIEAVAAMRSRLGERGRR